MNYKYKKIKLDLKFRQKRNYKLITPCCSKLNKDGKFVNYKGLRECYGYCHSCGETRLPPTQYTDENGSIYVWDTLQNKFIPFVLQSSCKSVGQLSDKDTSKRKTSGESEALDIKFIENKLVSRCMKVKPQNNLLSYISNTYGEDNKDFVKDLYKIGTSKDGGTIFWNINKNQKVQKAKICFYDLNGKRTNKFRVPYKNEQGYFSCLFGEHLLCLEKHKNKPIVLVESEKTAVICTIHFKKYNWLSYGGINGMTNDKMKALSGKRLLIVPDLSENARRITLKKIEELKQLNIDAKMWDVSNDLTDLELKEQGFYNFDLEDFLRMQIK